MKPKEVSDNILKNFDVESVLFSSEEDEAYRFHIRVDADTKFNSFYSYPESYLQDAIDDITTVLIKMGLERGPAFWTKCEPTGEPVTLADSASILKTLYPPGDFPAILQKNISSLGAKGGAETSRPFDGLSAYLPDRFTSIMRKSGQLGVDEARAAYRAMTEKLAEQLCTTAEELDSELKEKSLDEEFPVKPNGFRWL